MANEVWGTCMLVSGVSQANCAGWVQAWGSIIGLGIAIAIPLILRSADQRNKRAAELAAANVVGSGSGLVLMLGPLLGAINAVISEIQEHEAGALPQLDARPLTALMQGLPYPNEWQMLQISPFEPETATALARGTHLFLQGRNSIQLLSMQVPNDPGAITSMILPLKGIFLRSKTQFERAKADLEEFFDLHEGAEEPMPQ